MGATDLRKRVFGSYDRGFEHYVQFRQFHHNY